MIFLKDLWHIWYIWYVRVILHRILNIFEISLRNSCCIFDKYSNISYLSLWNTINIIFKRCPICIQEIYERSLIYLRDIPEISEIFLSILVYFWISLSDSWYKSEVHFEYILYISEISLRYIWACFKIYLIEPWKIYKTPISIWDIP